MMRFIRLYELMQQESVTKKLTMIVVSHKDSFVLEHHLERSDLPCRK